MVFLVVAAAEAAVGAQLADLEIAGEWAERHYKSSASLTRQEGRYVIGRSHITTLKSSITNSKWYMFTKIITCFIFWSPPIAHFVFSHDLLAL